MLMLLDLLQVEALVKESKDADELNRGLAELVAKGWKEIASSFSQNSQNGRTGSPSMQPNCFQNLSTCSILRTTSEHVLELRLENKDINNMCQNSTGTEIEKKKELAISAEAGKMSKRRKVEVAQSMNCETFSEKEAEKMLLSMVGTDDTDNVFKIISSLSRSFEFSRSLNQASPCYIPRDSLLDLASLEESFIQMKMIYPCPYSDASNRVVELRCEASSMEEEEQQRELARLKDQLGKDGDLEKYLRGKEKLDELLQKNEVDLGDGKAEVENEEVQREDARLKEQLRRDVDLEKYQRGQRKFLELKQQEKDEIKGSSPCNGGVKVEPDECENQGGLMEVEEVQKELAIAKDKLSRGDKDVQEYRRERKIILRRALDRLKKQLETDRNMKRYLAGKALIDKIDY